MFFTQVYGENRNSNVTFVICAACVRIQSFGVLFFHRIFSPAASFMGDVPLMVV